MQTEEGRQCLFVAIDRTSKMAFAELQPQATKMLAAEFLRRVLAKLPYRVHTGLTDNGIQFGNMRHQPWAFRHIFDRICTEHGIEHRFTKPGHPWTNGQVERMNRTIKEATVHRYHYQTTAELNEHLQTFLLAYNHAKRLKTLRGLTPPEFICAQWQKNPVNFNQDPTHLTLGLYSHFVSLYPPLLELSAPARVVLCQRPNPWGTALRPAAGLLGYQCWCSRAARLGKWNFVRRPAPGNGT